MERVRRASLAGEQHNTRRRYRHPLSLLPTSSAVRKQNSTAYRSAPLVSGTKTMTIPPPVRERRRGAAINNATMRSQQSAPRETLVSTITFRCPTGRLKTITEHPVPHRRPQSQSVYMNRRSLPDLFIHFPIVTGPGRSWTKSTTTVSFLLP